jgi:hypothetical protein
MGYGEDAATNWTAAWERWAQLRRWPDDKCAAAASSQQLAASSQPAAQQPAAHPLSLAPAPHHRPCPCRRVLFELVGAIPAELRAQLASIAIDGTSATAVLLDRRGGAVLAPAKLYNEAQPVQAMAAAKVRARVAPPSPAGRGCSRHGAGICCRRPLRVASRRAAGHRPAAAHRHRLHLDALQAADLAPAGRLAGGQRRRPAAGPAAPGGLAGLAAARPPRHQRLEQRAQAGLRPRLPRLPAVAHRPGGPGGWAGRRLGRRAPAAPPCW